ncbi:hypothetical protein CN300_30530 [Bacillus thuringiensis]|nr:hypothetical protein CN418_31870 [Bacillus thuringiensis]PEY66005.1 hypothetical protein CN355_27980 [Bacillus thuringiensis]PFC37548.1 hypothetical protein CN300_30530 [Bacillus thuringiensis]PFR45031.1 hypothetical protein COK27_03085 [Bacillus thuringiensis]PGL22782.1 hypothetical protein CN921_20465 [Bacillus thuringiensis]
MLGDKALNKVGHIAKGAKVSSGVSTFANAVKLAKELKPTLEMLQSFKREASYALSSVGGTIVTKIPQGELIEAYYKFAKSKDGGKGTGETLSKQKSIPDFVKKQWEAGNRFNKENRPRYPYNEVELEAKEINGKKYVVDSYIPGEEIVSRKFTQLAEVKEKTALSYLSEFTKKYSSGSEISSGKFNPNALKGGRLDGELILEIPVQTKPVPQKIIEEANEKGIIIRDINGKVYN